MDISMDISMDIHIHGNPAYCGQTVGWIKMKLGGVEVGLVPGRIVLDGDPAPPSPKGHSPQFSAHVLWSNGWMIKMSLGTEVGLSPGHIVLDGDSSPKRGHGPQFSVHVCCSKRLDSSRCHLVWR